jgi:hypothetical protein
MADHTPGPWLMATYTDHKPNADRGDWCGEIYSKTGGKVYHGPFSFHAVPNEANARLIAAAPDLLAVCIGILECLDEKDRWTSVSRRFAAESLRKAIAKATGS